MIILEHGTLTDLKKRERKGEMIEKKREIIMNYEYQQNG